MTVEQLVATLLEHTDGNVDDAVATARELASCPAVTLAERDDYRRAADTLDAGRVTNPRCAVCNAPWCDGCDDDRGER